MNTHSDRLAQTLDYVKYLLQNFTLKATLTKGGWGDILTIAFGDNYNETSLDSILTPWVNGDFSNLPEMEVSLDSDYKPCGAGQLPAKNTKLNTSKLSRSSRPFTPTIVSSCYQQ